VSPSALAGDAPPAGGAFAAVAGYLTRDGPIRRSAEQTKQTL
jgi:hypothetical protein